MRCGNCSASVPETAMFCPECGADARATDADDAGEQDADASEVAAGPGEAAADADTGDAAGAAAATEDEFEWGSDATSEAGDGSTVDAAEASAADEESTADDVTWADSDDVAWADSDDDPPEFEEPTRLSRPADSRHPEPLMGTNDEVVGHRVGAFLVDRFVLLVMIVGPFVVAIPLEPVVGESAASAVAGLGFLAAIVGILVYTLLLEGFYGQTLGKRLFGIVVVKEDGSPCTVGASILRSILWFADRYFFGLVALGLLLTTERTQRFGDMVADTVVVRVA